LCALSVRRPIVRKRIVPQRFAFACHSPKRPPVSARTARCARQNRRMNPRRGVRGRSRRLPSWAPREEWGQACATEDASAPPARRDAPSTGSTCRSRGTRRGAPRRRSADRRTPPSSRPPSGRPRAASATGSFPDPRTSLPFGIDGAGSPRSRRRSTSIVAASLTTTWKRSPLTSKCATALGGRAAGPQPLTRNATSNRARSRNAYASGCRSSARRSRPREFL
jgi:hypothetical protein